MRPSHRGGRRLQTSADERDGRGRERARIAWLPREYSGGTRGQRKGRRTV